MADTKLSALSLVTTPAIDDLVYIDQAGVSYGIQAQNLKTGDFLKTLNQAEISVTGAVTATISRMHVCSGTSANYTVTLPAVSGNTGKLLGFRMATGLTKLVTLDGNASELIDGALTRVVWAGESALLLCDGSNWFKIAGKGVPFSGQLYRAAAQSFADATYAKCLLDTLVFDASGLFADATNSRFNIPRTNSYQAQLFGRFDRITFTYEVVGGFYKNNTTELARGSANAPSPVSTVGATTLQYTAGDTAELWLFHGAGATLNTLTSAGVQPRLSMTEVLSW